MRKKILISLFAVLSVIVLFWGIAWIIARDSFFDTATFLGGSIAALLFSCVFLYVSNKRKTGFEVVAINVMTVIFGIGFIFSVFMVSRDPVSLIFPMITIMPVLVSVISKVTRP